ncbi:MAG TPA: hypothetical protein VJA21_01265 [Verrucomicrobiae bacterium]
MTVKTLRSAFRRTRLTPKTEQKLNEFVTKLVEKVRGKSSVALTRSQNLRTWEIWRGLGDYQDNNFPATCLPRTRQLLKDLAAQEGVVVDGFFARLPHISAATCYLLTSPLAVLLAAPCEVRIGPLLKSAKKLRTPQDFLAFRTQDERFRYWQAHCVVSLIMRILAQADVEISRELKSGRSIVAPILPAIRNGKLHLPIRLLLERWANLLNVSYKKMSAQGKGRLDEEDSRRKLESWLNNEHTPSIESIRILLEGIVPNQQEREWAVKRYRIALLLTHLFEVLQLALPHVGVAERISLFVTFHRHRSGAEMRANNFPPSSHTG